MKIVKPNFWDYKRPSFISYCLLPFTFPLILNNFFFFIIKNKFKKKNIKTICVGNIYVGGTAKTPLTIKLDQILKKLRFKTGTIKKDYKNQLDEQHLLKKKTNLYCSKKRIKALDSAIKDNIDIAIFDDGLQDSSINYDLSFVCFNINNWIGNGFLIPAGPLREKLKSISKYDAIFLNGNEEDVSELKKIIKKYNSSIKIFETSYIATNIDKIDIRSNYLIFSGIGNPEGFKKTLIKNNINIIGELVFPDHYTYTFDDIKKIRLKALSLNAKLLTTEKDFVKLTNYIPNDIKFLQIDILVKHEAELINFIKLKI